MAILSCCSIFFFLIFDFWFLYLREGKELYYLCYFKACWNTNYCPFMRCTDEKIKLWLFLPGRHSSVAEAAQVAVSRLRGILCSQIILWISFDPASKFLHSVFVIIMLWLYYLTYDIYPLIFWKLLHLDSGWLLGTQKRLQLHYLRL